MNAAHTIRVVMRIIHKLTVQVQIITFKIELNRNAEESEII